MHLDVVDLRNFYYRTKLGRVAQRAVRDRVVALWPDVKGQTVAGFGFAAPLLRPFLGPARRVVALMPGPQGVMPWPAGMPNVSVLTEETRWPLATGSVDRLVMLHGLETSEHPDALLDEAGRVLGPGGRMLVIVPSRSGLWARADRTPFGFGRPYSLGQLEAQLRGRDFVPETSMGALFAPPSGASVLAAHGRRVGEERPALHALAGGRRADRRGLQARARRTPGRDPGRGAQAAPRAGGGGGDGARGGLPRALRDRCHAALRFTVATPRRLC